MQWREARKNEDILAGFPCYAAILALFLFLLLFCFLCLFVCFLRQSQKKAGVLVHISRSLSREKQMHGCLALCYLAIIRELSYPLSD